MEKQIEIKECALQQLYEEFEYYKKEYSIDYAEKFREGFFEIIESISPNYLSFPECRFLTSKTKKYRNIVWNNYLIVFKIKASVIEILSIFHTKRNPRRLKKLRRIK